MMFGQGIDRVGEVCDLAVDLDIIKKSGAWFSYNGQKIGQGRENAKQYLKENRQICDEIERKVRAYYGLPVPEEDKAKSAGADAGRTAETGEA